MKLLDLFAGIGGFSLAAHWMGWETVAFVERDKFCQKVLRKNFGDDIEIHDDITTFSGQSFRGRVDIVTGGFPCQPYSLAGKRKGTNDARHLWPEMLRTIREVQPRFVVGENVFGLLNWSGGLVFEQVQADLEAAGYEVWAGVVPACGVGAPHRRNRIWFIANALNDDYLRTTGKDESSGGEERLQERNQVQRAAESVGLRDVVKSGSVRCNDWKHSFAERHVSGNGRIASKGKQERKGRKRGLGAVAEALTDTDSKQREVTRLPVSEGSRTRQRNDAIGSSGIFERFPSKPGLYRRNDGISGELDEVKSRIKSLGNAIVPAVAYELFKAIESADAQKQPNKMHKS